MSECKTSYQTIAELIYAEHPNLKEALNIGAKLAIEGLTGALETTLPASDLEKVLAMVAHVVADLLSTPANNLSNKLNLFFDTYSLAAGAVIGEIDLGDTSAAKDMATLMQEAEAHAQEHMQAYEEAAPPTGQYL